MPLQHDLREAFNKAHTSYDNHNILQTHVGSQLIRHILSVNHKQPLPHIIDLGCGTGIITERLADTIPFSTLHAVDFASHLLAVARTRLTRPNIHLLVKDFNEPLGYTEQFDIAFSNMSLQWSADLNHTLSMLRSQLKRHSLLAFSIPLNGSLHEISPRFTINAFHEHHAIVDLLIRQGFDVLFTREESIVLHFKNTLSALKYFRQIGARAHKRPDNHLRGKDLLTTSHVQQLTYQIGYFIARKSEHPCQSDSLLPARTPALEKHVSALHYSMDIVNPAIPR